MNLKFHKILSISILISNHLVVNVPFRWDNNWPQRESYHFEQINYWTKNLITINVNRITNLENQINKMPDQHKEMIWINKTCLTHSYIMFVIPRKAKKFTDHTLINYEQVSGIPQVKMGSSHTTIMYFLTYCRWDVCESEGLLFPIHINLQNLLFSLSKVSITFFLNFLLASPQLRGHIPRKRDYRVINTRHYKCGIQFHSYLDDFLILYKERIVLLQNTASTQHFNFTVKMEVLVHSYFTNGIYRGSFWSNPLHQTNKKSD